MTLGLALAADTIVLLLAVCVYLLAGRVRDLAERVARLEGELDSTARQKGGAES